MNKKILIIIIVIIVLIGGYFLLSKNDKTLEIIQQENEIIDNLVSQEKEKINFNLLRSTQLVTILPEKDFFLVNVHIPYDGEIANTDAFIPYNTIGQNLNQLPDDKNAKIVLYCRSGGMSTVAAKKLTTLGYTNVYNLTGGMIEWKAQGQQIIRK